MKIKTVLLCVMVAAVVVGTLMFIRSFGFFGWAFDSERQDQARTTDVAEVRVRPLDLPCKSRIDARVPVQGEAKYTVHSFIGSLTVNTDTVRLTAIGDVDTCFPAAGAVVEKAAEDWLVRIDASQTVFNRPRVKPAATARSVNYKPGFGRLVADFVPIIDYFMVKENSSQLTLEAQAFAQSVIGGSRCMRAAWPATKQAIVQTYQDEARRQGIKPQRVQVTFSGQPRFDQNDMKKVPEEFGATKFTVDNHRTECRLVR